MAKVLGLCLRTGPFSVCLIVGDLNSDNSVKVISAGFVSSADTIFHLYLIAWVMHIDAPFLSDLSASDFSSHQWTVAVVVITEVFSQQQYVSPSCVC